MITKISRSDELLKKVYDHLNTIDVTKLSFAELKDFLGVVQQGRFLETFGQTASPIFNGFGGAKPSYVTASDSGEQDEGNDDWVE